MVTYDPRTISTLVYQNLNRLKQTVASETDQKEQKNQAVEIYSYIATWGLLRLKAEEFALSGNTNRNKRKLVECFFQTLGKLVSPDEPNIFDGNQGLQYLSNSQQLGASEYLGLTGIALQVAREFAFWAEALYPKLDR
jgi:hypothetical protein